MSSVAGEALGALCAEHASGGAKLSIHDNGFSVEKAGRTVAGPYDRIARVDYQETLVRINGIPLPQSTRLVLHLPDGESFAFAASGQERAAALQQLVVRASGPIARRCQRELDAGQDVDFGAFRLSHKRLAWKGAFGSDKELPLERLSGFLLSKGWFLVDADPAEPHVVVERRIGVVSNAFALVELLRGLKPDADLEDPQVAERSRARASGLPWRQTTAVKRWIGTPSRPARFAMLAGLFGLPLLWALLACIPAGLRQSKQSSAQARYRPLAARAESVLEEMASTPAPTTGTAAACTAKVPTDDLGAVAAWIGEFPSETPGGKLWPYDTENVSSTLVAGYRGKELWGRKKDTYDDSFGMSWSTMVSEPPWTWGRRMYVHYPDMTAIKYLAVARIESLTLTKRASGSGERPDRAKLRVRVVDAASGNTVCEGADSVRLASWEHGAIPLERAPFALLCGDATKSVLCTAANTPESPFVPDVALPAATAPEASAPPRTSKHHGASRHH